MSYRTVAIPAVERISVRWDESPNTFALAQWDSLVERSSGTDVTQLSAWAVIRARVGFSPVFLFAYQGGALVGGCLVQRRRVFGVLRVCYVPYGPLVDTSRADASLVTPVLLRELTKLAESSAMTFIQPPENADDISFRLLANGFRHSSAGIAPAGSYRLDLTRPLADIRSGFSARLKSWTNRWESKGVTVRRGDTEDLPILGDLIAATAARQGFPPPPVDQLDSIYRELSPAGHSALFIGEVDGRPVAADLVTMLGDTVHGRRCGFDSSGAAGRLSVPAAVRWTIINWAKTEGYRWLDFGGLPEQMLADMLDKGIRSSDAWPSGHRSKLAFNGEPFRYPPAVELLRPFAVRWVYDMARRNTYGRRMIVRVKSALRIR